MGPRFESVKVHHGPLVKWLRQRPLTPLTSVRIRYGSPDFSRAKVLDKGSEIQYNTVCSPARPDDIELVLIRARVHPFPFRTRQLSSFLLTILGWRRPGKITQRLHLSSNESCCFFFFLQRFCGVYELRQQYVLSGRLPFLQVCWWT